MTLRCINEDTILVPCSTLHSNVFVERMFVLQVLASQNDIVLRHECDMVAIWRPHDVPNIARHGNLIYYLLCCQIIHHHFLFTFEQDAIWATSIDVVWGNSRNINLLGDLILKIVDAYGTAALQNSESVASSETHSLRTTRAILNRCNITRILTRSHKKIKAPTILAIHDQDVYLLAIICVVHQRFQSCRHRIGRAATFCDTGCIHPLV
mmetsp:Transcript_61994/g.98259  ORF Transcript_61994/g.98259 Transcript_61994/m.98259 type:complete len:209 (+) Transcript_61994:2253-2879(+)